MSDQMPGVVGCGLLATDEGLTLRGLGCVNDNDNAVLTRLDFRTLSLRRNEQCWFHIPAGYRGQQVWIVGVAFTGVKDFMNRDGMAGAFAVITEAAFARDGYAEGVFLARAIMRAMNERMIDKATTRVQIAPASQVLQLAGPELAQAPKHPPIEVDMEGAAIEVSVTRNWAAEIVPDALMLMVRNQRQTFEPLLSAGYVLRENIGDRTQWAIDANFYKKFYYREIFQKNKTLIESNSQLQEAVGKEQVRVRKLKSAYDELNEKFTTLERRVATLKERLGDAENEKGVLVSRAAELDQKLRIVERKWSDLKAHAESLRRQNESLLNDGGYRAPTTQNGVNRLLTRLHKYQLQNAALKQEVADWEEFHDAEEQRYEAQIANLLGGARHDVGIEMALTPQRGEDPAPQVRPIPTRPVRSERDMVGGSVDDIDIESLLASVARQESFLQLFAIGVIIVGGIVAVLFGVGAVFEFAANFAKE